MKSPIIDEPRVTGPRPVAPRDQLRVFDYAVALWIVVFLALLQPAMVDGDGLYYAAAAAFPGPATGTEMKHPLYVPLLLLVQKILDILGHPRASIPAFCVVSHLAAAGLYLALARGLYGHLLRNAATARIMALGVIASYAVLSRAVTIEVYLPALLAAVVLILACIRLDLTRPWAPTLCLLLFLLAVALHVANLTLLPAVVAILALRLAPPHRVSFFLRMAVTGALALPLVVAFLRLRLGLDPWSLDLAPILPGLDPEPPMSLALRLARAAYGMARAIVYLPGRRELAPSAFAIPVVWIVLGLSLLVHLLRNTTLDRRHATRFLVPLVALILPIAALGIRYYPSEVERWIFLVPVVWFVIGLVIDAYRPQAGHRFTPRRATTAAALGVLALAAINTNPLLRDARHNRDLSGLRRLAELAEPGDLVLSPAGIRSRILDRYLPARPDFENVTFYDLSRAHTDRESIAAELANRVSHHLDSGRRVLVFGLFDEGLEEGVGFPWAHLPVGRGPSFFEQALRPFQRKRLVAPGPNIVGLSELVALDPNQTAFAPSFSDH